MSQTIELRGSRGLHIVHVATLYPLRNQLNPDSKAVPKLCPNIQNNPSQNRMEPHQ